MPASSTVQTTNMPFMVLFILCLLYALTTFLRICITPLAPDIEVSFNASATQVSYLASALFIGYSLMQIPGGILTDTLGSRKTLLLFMTLAAGSTLAVALSPNINMAAMFRFLTGMSIAIVPAILVILARYVRPERFAQMAGIVLAMGDLGSIAGGTPLAVLNKYVGWQTSLYISSGVGFLLVALAFFVIKDAQPKADAPQKPFNLAAVGRDLLLVFKDKQFWPIAVWQSAVGGTVFVFASAWWTKYLIGTGGLTRIEASHIFVGQAISILVFLPLISTISDKIHSRKIILVSMSFLALFVCLSHVFLAGKLGFIGLLIQACSFSITMACSGACLMTMIKETFPPHLVGTAIGCANTFYPLYAAVATPIFGTLVEYKYQALTTTGMEADAATLGAYAFGCWTLVLGAGIAIIASLFLKESYREPQESS